MAYIGRDIEYGVLEKQTLTADSSTVAFDLTYISNANGLIVSVGGVVQEPNVAYTVLGSTLTFTAAPTTGDIVYVVYLGQEMTVSEITPTDYMDYQVGTGDGSDTTPITTLNHSVSLAQDIMVTLNGIRQVPSTDYGVSGTTLTFTTAPADGVAILVYFLVLVRANGTVVDNSVTDAKIVGMSGSKITTGTVPAGAVSNASIIGMDAAKLTGTLPESMGADLSLSYQRLATLGLHVQNLNNKVAFNLTDSFLDSFEDSTGVDSVNSVNALVSSDEYVTSASEADNATNIAPSSNDWDYSFDGGNEWPVAGNSLGDHTIGGYIDNIGGDSAISSLITFDGDFEIEWTATGASNHLFGVHAIDEDDTRTTDNRVGMKSMTNSFFWESGGTNPEDFFIGSSAQSDTNTFAAGSVIKIERVSGTIKVYDDGVVVHTYGTTYTGTMRFSIGAPGSPFNLNYDNILFTDTEKVQRDGMFDENQATSRSFGHGPALDNMGTRFIATRSGSVTSVKCNVHSVFAGFTAHAEMWLGTSTSPTSQVGSDSNTQSFASTGDKTFTFTDVTLQKGQVYWLICVGPSTGTGDVSMKCHTAPIGDGAYEIVTGRHSTITSITDNIPQVMAMEITIDTSAGEPTPDHDTLLLIQSDTTNGSQTFVDSSQTVASITVGGNTQHDTSQNLGFGTSSILFDGTGDYLTVPNRAPFSSMKNNGNSDMTVDAIIRLNSTGATRFIMAVGSASAYANALFWMHINHTKKLAMTVQNNGGAGVALIGATTFTTGVDYHVAYVKRGSVHTLYVNGTSDGTATSAITLTDSTQPLTIGADARLTIQPWDGWIKEPRFSNVARWDADFTPPTAAYGTATNTTLSATGSLVSTASTADSTVSEVTGAILVKDSVGTATLGTDLKAYFSANNGSNWTEAASYGSPTTFDGTTNVIPLGKTTVSNTGTAVKMKAEWANQVATVPATGTTKSITPYGDATLSSSRVKFGASSMYFDGTGDYLTSADHADYDFSGDFTVDFWMYNTGIVTNAAHLIGNANHTTGAGGGWALYCNGTGILKFNDYGNGISTGNTNVGWTANTWHHVAVTKTNNTVKLWLDGQEKASVSHTSAITSTNDLGIGSDNGVSASMYYNGYMDEFRISNTARYTANFTPSTTAFTSDANTKLLIHSDTTDDGVTFTDSSSSGHTVNAVGDVKHSATEKKYEQSSIYFDGTGDHLSVPDNSDLNFGSNDFTIEMWIKTSTGNKGILEHSDYTGTSGNFSIFSVGLHISSSHLYTQVCIGGSRHAMTSSSNIANNVWHHIAVVRYGNVFKSYIDGVEESTVTASGSLNDVSNPMKIGDAPYNGTTYAFNGYMDEIRISNTARYTSNNFTPPTATFSNNENTKLLIQSDDASQIFTDSSSNTHTVTAVGDAKHKPVVKKIGASSLLFDGAGDYLTLPKTDDWQWTGDFTIETWFYLNSLDRGSFFSTTIEDSTTGGIGLLFELEGGSGKVTLQCRAGSGSNQVIQSSGLSTGQWYHVALVRSGTASGNTKVYLDGVALGATSTHIGAILFPASVVKIGKSRDDSATTFDGYMDEFRVSDSARYTADFTPSTTAFTADANTQLLIHGDDALQSVSRTSSADKWAGNGTSHVTFSGSNIKTNTGDKQIYVPEALEGDFEITGTWYGSAGLNSTGQTIVQSTFFGVYATSETYTDSNDADNMTQIWSYDAANNGNRGAGVAFGYAQTNLGQFTPTNGDTFKMSRIGGVFYWYFADVLRHTWTQTYTGPVRIIMAWSGQVNNEILNLAWTGSVRPITDSSYAPAVIGKVAQLHGWAVNY